MDKMDKVAEGRIVRAIEEAIELTNRGISPDEAIRKQAETNQFGPQIVQRMVEAYNTSRTLAHLKHASGFARADNFPLADAAKVLGVMYPAKVQSPAKQAAASVVHTDYNRPEGVNYMRKNAGVAVPPLTRKKVEAIPRDFAHIAQLNYDKRAGIIKKVAALESSYRQQHYLLWSHVKAASEHFRKLYHEPFSKVEEKAAGEFGAVGRSVMNLVYAQGDLTEKRAELKEVRQLTYDMRQEPYNHIAGAVKVAHDLYEVAAAVVDAREGLEKFCQDNGLPAAVVKQATQEVTHVVAPLDRIMETHHLPFEKNALIPSLLSGPLLLAGGMGALGLSEPSKERSDVLREKADLEAFDPIHETDMRTIKTKAMLNDMLSNDPIISSYDPDEVRQAYNQMSQLTPEVAAQPSVMRAMLRRLLQQENIIEPHEADQLTSVEKNLREVYPALKGIK